RPHRSARLPYTTLFRSQNLIYSIPLVRWLGEHSYFYSLAFNTTWSFFKTRLQQEARARADSYGVSANVEYALPTREHSAAEIALDRKSTRLNSSHVKIS